MPDFSGRLRAQGRVAILVSRYNELITSRLLEGIVENGARAIADGALTAAIGPGIGPCCYEVGPDVAEPYEAAFGAEVLRDGRLDLWRATELALERVGVEGIERTDLCTYCHPELFFSHRRDRGTTGRQGVIAAVT